MTSLPGMKKNIWLPNADLLVFKVLLYYKKMLNIYFGKQTVKFKKDFTNVLRVGLLFDSNLQYCSIMQLLNFWLSFRLVLL